MRPTASTAITSTPRARSPKTPPGNSGRNSHVAHSPTAALSIPNASDVRPGHVRADEPGQPRPDPEGRQVDADDQRELGDRVAQDVAGQGPREQLVDQPAGGHRQDVQEQDGGAVHGGPLAPRAVL